eukprot:3190884-Pleurochrysis_carterae.AAC.2
MHLRRASTCHAHAHVTSTHLSRARRSLRLGARRARLYPPVSGEGYAPVHSSGVRAVARRLVARLWAPSPSRRSVRSRRPPRTSGRTTSTPPFLGLQRRQRLARDALQMLLPWRRASSARRAGEPRRGRGRRAAERPKAALSRKTSDSETSNTLPGGPRGKGKGLSQKTKAFIKEKWTAS